MPSNSILNIKKDGEWVEIPCLTGEDGFSPTATVEKVGKVTTITITDINGTTTATIADGTSSGGSGEENTIESISVNGTLISIDENKNVDITVPSIDGFAKTEDIPTKVSELTNDSGYLTEHQDISGKVDKVEGKSLISDTEIARLASVDNYDDTDIRTELASKGTYSKPSDGIPASDLASGVIPTSLPASNVTNTYSATGTAPVSGKAVASALSDFIKISGTTLIIG